MGTSEEQKEELQGLIRDSRGKSEEIITRSRLFLQWGQYTADLADASEMVIGILPPAGISWVSGIEGWRYLNKQQDELLRQTEGIAKPSSTSSASTVAYVMSDFAKEGTVIPLVASVMQDDARKATEQLSCVIDRVAEKDNIRSLLQQYGLSTSPSGQKSSLDLFESAWNAFEIPASPEAAAETSLIPMRECINSVIAALLRRRQRQEPAKTQRAKILSIVGQLAGPGVTQWAIESMADRWDKLLDELSGSKQQRYSREEWRDCLRRASLFIMEFLQSLDPSKAK